MFCSEGVLGLVFELLVVMVTGLAGWLSLGLV